MPQQAYGDINHVYTICALFPASTSTFFLGDESEADVDAAGQPLGLVGALCPRCLERRESDPEWVGCGRRFIAHSYRGLPDV